MASSSDDLIAAIERLQQTPAPNYPINGYELADWKTLHAFLGMLQDGSEEALELVAGQILETVPPLRLADDDVTADQLKYHYAVSSLREAARSVVESGRTGVVSLFLKQEDFADQLAEIRKGIEFVQAAVDDVKEEIRKSPLDGFSVNLGPIGVPLLAVAKAAGLAATLLGQAAGVDAVALSLQLQGMTSNARLALRHALSIGGAANPVTKLLQLMTEQAAATADVGLAVLRKAVQSMEQVAGDALLAASPVRVGRALGLTTDDVAIDFGTSKLRVYAKGRGPVVSCDTVGEIRGANATRLEWLSGAAWSRRPIIAGVVADSAATEAILKRGVAGAKLARGLAKPKALVAVPAGSTAVERRAMRRVVKTLPSSKVQLIEAPVAAAIGAGLNVQSLDGYMVGDIGAGKTEVSIIALSGLVYSRMVRVGGDDLTNRIHDFLFRTRDLFITFDECERLKINLTTVDNRHGPDKSYNLVGFNKLGKSRTSHTITSTDINTAISEPISHIIEGFKIALEATPPEIANSIQRNGIMLTGGTALLSGLAEEIRDHTGMPVNVAVEPETAVIRGLGRILEDGSFSRLFEIVD